MVINRSKKIIITGICALLLGFGIYQVSFYEKGPIYTFNSTRDTKPILDIFDKNWYWLIANEGASPAFMLRHLTPTENPLYFGKLIVKVMRKGNEFIGFIAYYMENRTEGRLLFLAVDSKFRGHGYGHFLAEYAVEDMIDRGAQKIGLWTRLENVAAQKIYTSLGFTESFYTPGGYVFFEYIP